MTKLAWFPKKVFSLSLEHSQCDIGCNKHMKYLIQTPLSPLTNYIHFNMLLGRFQM